MRDTCRCSSSKVLEVQKHIFRRPMGEEQIRERWIHVVLIVPL